MAAFWSLAILLFYGANWLHTELRVTSNFLGVSRIPGMERLPLIGVTPSIAFFLALALLVFGLMFLNKWINKPETNNVLVETESELRKVTWPTLDEAINGSFVVIIAVLFLMAFLAGTDYLLTRITRRVLLGVLGL